LGAEPRQEKRIAQARRRWERPSLAAALVAGAFVLAVLLVLVVGYARENAADPLDSPEIASLRELLRKSPTDTGAKERFRVLDLELRTRFFAHQRRVETGRWLLLAGGAALALALGILAELRRTLPEPPSPEGPAHEVARGRSLAAVAGIGVAVGLAALVLALLQPGGPAKAGRAAGQAAGDGSAPQRVASSEEPAPPTPEELARNWPRFRGPGGAGVARFASGEEGPLSWDAATGAGLLWKSRVPLKGASSPVFWNGRLFLTGADASTREAYCFDAADGRLVWRKVVSSEPPRGGEKKVWDEKTYAASTPATDGRSVWCVFASGDVACLDLEGREVWKKNLGPIANSYGHASSPVSRGRFLYIQLDQARDEKTKTERSRLLALDGATGRVMWERPRPVRDSWTTPIIVESQGREELVTVADQWIIAYDPASGEELWRAKGPKGDLVPSPIFAGGLVIAAMEMSRLVAVRPGGSGDVTSTHVAWTAEGDLPSIPSPVSDGERLYLVSSAGMMSAWQLSTGAKLWEADLEMAVQSSPTLAGDRVYVFGDEGACAIVAAGPEYRLLARNELGEGCQASPAFAAGRMFIRGEEHLFCVGKASDAAAAQSGKPGGAQ